MTQANLEVMTPVWDHVDDLRHTLIRILSVIGAGIFLSLFFYKPLFDLIVQPTDSQLVILHPAEGMTSVFKMAFWMGLVFTSPIWLYFVFRFIAPALRPREMKVVIPFFGTSLLLGACGGVFAFYFAIPMANHYLNAFNQSLGVNLWSLSSYLNYTLVLFLANVLAFEMCGVLLFLVHFGWLTHEWLQSKRRHFFVAIFALSALLTPPDVLSQIMLALPLISFYEAARLYSKFRRSET